MAQIVICSLFATPLPGFMRNRKRATLHHCTNTSQVMIFATVDATTTNEYLDAIPMSHLKAGKPIKRTAAVM